jgi:hypothetical protein
LPTILSREQLEEYILIKGIDIMPNPKNPWRYKNDPDYRRRVDAHDVAQRNKRLAHYNPWSEGECICAIVGMILVMIVITAAAISSFISKGMI